MTDKEHGVTVEYPPSDWKETWGLQKQFLTHNVFTAQKQFTED